MKTLIRCVRDTLYFGLVMVASAGLAGCAGVPRTHLNAYLENFSTVRGAAEDIYLRAGAIAKDISERPETEGSISERLKKLNERNQALSARLEAFALVDRYNTLISHLAAGENPKDLKDGLWALQQNLATFRISGLAHLAKAHPALNLIADGVSMVDDAIKKKKFEKAVLKAQGPMLGIVDILLADVGDLETLFVDELGYEQDIHRAKADSLAKRYFKQLQVLKPSEEVDKLTDRYNETRQRMAGNKARTMTHKPKSDASEAMPTDLEVLAILIDQVEAAVSSFNDVEQRISAQRAVMESYRQALDSTKKAFVELAVAIEQGRVGATVDFAVQAMEFRKAVMQFQEVR